MFLINRVDTRNRDMSSRLCELTELNLRREFSGDDGTDEGACAGSFEGSLIHIASNTELSWYNSRKCSIKRLKNVEEAEGLPMLFR